MHFGRPMAENFDWLFLTGVRPESEIIILSDQMGQISKFFPWIEYFAPKLDASGPESFSPGIFNYFGCPTAENFDLVFLTSVRVNGAFDRRATKVYVLPF